MVGVRYSRSQQDEKLVAAICSSSEPLTTMKSSSNSAEALDIPGSSPGRNRLATSLGSPSMSNSFEATEDEEMSTSYNGAITLENGRSVKIYGAQQQNLIIDCRPVINAMAMQVAGKGSEDMKNYPCAKKTFLNIENIHIMRKSLNKVFAALKDSDVTPLAPHREQLVQSGWLKHIALILDGAKTIAQQVGLFHSHVLIHCSDGWDRTAQLSSLSSICLDPYYRTLDGFIVLVEKDWLSFGHRFRYRSGPLSSEKWFEVENERVGGAGIDSPFGGGKGALENALSSAKGFFNKNNDSRDSLADQEEMQSMDLPSSSKGTPVRKAAKDDKVATKQDEISPVFHQFLDCTYQMLHQYPTRFEFNERFLRRLLYQLYSCQYGTFLYNNEKERVDEKASEMTRSVWDYFLARRREFLNPEYNATIDDKQRGQERLLFPDCDRVRWWAEAFGRSDEEMNDSSGPIGQQEAVSTVRPPVVTGFETAEVAIDLVRPEEPGINGHSAEAEVKPVVRQMEALGIGDATPDTDLALE